MAKGGKRAGAGRPVGSKNSGPNVHVARAEATKEKLRTTFVGKFDEEVLNEDPVETMEFARYVFRQLFKDTEELSYLKEAMTCALASAPYLRQRLALKDQKITVEGGFGQLSDEQIMALAAIADSQEGVDGTTH
jgi:hypothetical protein